MFRSSAPVSEDQLKQALDLIRQGRATESKVQNLLGVRASLARKVIDTLVEQGLVYRHARELHHYVAPFTDQDYDPNLEPIILQTLSGGKHTALSIKRRTGASERALRATLDQMLQRNVIQGHRIEALIVYSVS